MKGVIYNHVRLMPGSTALELYEAGKKNELDRHMERLDHEDRQRSGVAKTPAEEHFDALLHPCCLNEQRGWGGGCKNCGDPCL